MSTTTTTPSSSATSLAASAKVKAFVIAMALASPVLYVLCDIFGLPLFTYHPATNRIELGWAPGRSGEGPAMYWYGWTVTTILGGVAMGGIATLFPEQKVSLFTIWMTAIVATAVALAVGVWRGDSEVWMQAGIVIGVSVVLCGATAMLSENTNRKVLLHLLWTLPILAMIPLAFSLMPFWTKG